MSVVVVVGAQWGDEGKGKVVDWLTERAQVVARWGGGANAGHTIVVDGKKYVTRLMPSGVLRRGVTCVLGEGMVIDPRTLGEELRPFVGDASRFVHDQIKAGRNVLLEGAQGVLLDLDHGTYPYVSSSSTTAGGACAGLGIAPRHIDTVIGITKAYATRVGLGPFPTELHDELGSRLREVGGEFGAVTGRPRRCGWLDIPALRLTARISGIDAIALTKLDVLD